MGVVRLATVRDIKALAELCRAAVGPDDYVLAGGRRALATARRAAAMRGRKRVEIFLPNDRRIRTSADAAGFSPAAWGRHAVLYERRVRGGG